LVWVKTKKTRKITKEQILTFLNFQPDLSISTVELQVINDHSRRKLKLLFFNKILDHFIVSKELLMNPISNQKKIRAISQQMKKILKKTYFPLQAPIYPVKSGKSRETNKPLKSQPTQRSTLTQIFHC